MEREHLILNFARRLTKLMQDAGFKSSRSKAGVKLKVLAEVGACSHQMARRYVLGEAFPDIGVIFNIARWLKVSPGWLLFGDDSSIPNNMVQKNLIQIEPDLLEYILEKSSELFFVTQDRRELINFIMDIINDATHIEADKIAILKIIDISIHSALRFHGKIHDNSEKFG